MTHSRFPVQRVLLAACGSIAASALPESILVMRHALGLDVRAVLTRQAATFVSPRALTAVSGNSVETEDALPTSRPLHLELTEWAELVLVLPATANMLGKVANGIADDLVTTCVLASTTPVVLAPAMNAVMWNKPAVQRNIAQLDKDGYGVVPPVPVPALSGGATDGRGVPPVESVLDWTARFLASRATKRGDHRGRAIA